MKDKNIKTWLFIFVGTLAVSSGAASFFAQQKTLYKGLEPLQWNFTKASALTADEIQPAQLAQPASFSQTEIKKSEEPFQKQIEAVEETPAKLSLEPVASPCGSDEKPVIKNSQIAGCAAVSVRSNPPAPKIKILENSSLRENPPSAETCESQSRFTYTGEDRPGLLYGMCIDCLTTQFAANGGKCK